MLRAILTILIIAFGVFALVIILSAIRSLEHTITGDFATMGANTFNIRQYDFDLNRSRDREKVNPVISYREAGIFKEQFSFPTAQTAISFTGTTTAEVKYQNVKTDPETPVLGVNQHFLANSGLELDRGRNFNVFDIQNNNPVCILGSDYLKGLFKDTDPIDKVVSVRGRRFRVIGVLKEKGSTFGNPQDQRMLIPIQLARSMFTRADINYDLSVMVGNADILDNAQEEAIFLFRNIRNLRPLDENNFGMERSDDLIRRIAKITGVLKIAAWAISIITIFGSSIALMNIMLVSVTERTREIGIRKALGARKQTIATQFLVETIVIGQMGGATGIVLGLAGGLAFAAIANFSFAMPWAAMIAAVIISFVVAVIAGFYPAAKAARLDPIASLRYE